jgi:Ca2+-binding EF-hand superfamily protein
MKKLITLVALAFATLSITAEEDLLVKLDSDKDGRISIEEAAEDAPLSVMFAELDTDKDGYLTSSELDKKS